MAHNKLYRNFIILQEDERGYSHSNDKALSGYAKVEAKGDKCKISFYAQNLRQDDNYSMVLICCKRDLKQLIDIGPLAINEVGKGDTCKEYYVNNIAGLGISYEKISGAAICKVKDNETEFVMHGFMNGEESTENWRKFKVVKIDSKKYPDKTAVQPKEKDNISTNIANKNIITQVSTQPQASTQPQSSTQSQSSTPEINLTKTAKLPNDLVERKKDDNDLQPEVNIESKVEDKQNRIPEDYQNIAKTTDNLDEDRHKNKECNKCEKDDKYDKYDKHDHDKCNKDDKYYKCDKCDKHECHEKEESVEEIIERLCKKLESYDGMIDLKLSHKMYEDVIVYCFIKDKKDCKSKWKKFKLEKKCRNDVQEQNIDNIQFSSRRIEENFKLDKLNGLDRKDIIDFDEYENNIQQGNSINNASTPSTGIMNQAETNITEVSKTNIEPETSTNQTTSDTEVNKVNFETIWQPWSVNEVSQEGTTASTEANTTASTETNTTEEGSMGKLDLGIVEEPKPVNNEKIEPVNNKEPELTSKKEITSNQDFSISGDIGKYFEKLAQGFEPFMGNLSDINFCKWYKIIVNGIEDLSNESNYNQYTLAYYPMLNYYPYISKMGHFLLGYKCNKDKEMQYIIYAIPGSKEKSDQPYGGRTGFVTWTSDDKNDQGYWLMFYDFKNSSIVIPAR